MTDLIDINLVKDTNGEANQHSNNKPDDHNDITVESPVSDRKNVFVNTENDKRHTGPNTDDQYSPYKSPNNYVDAEESLLEKPDQDVKEDLTPLPPDGGYGWVVVFASFMCNLIVDGIGYSFGNFRPELEAYFHTGTAPVAMVGSLLVGVLLVIGPVVSALCNKYGCRPVCIAGALIGASAFVFSTLCTNLYVLMFVYGVLGGVGFGMIYLPSIVTVGYYFDKKRSLATGIAVCGSGVGTLAISPLAVLLLKKYTWHNTNFIFAALIICCGLFGYLLKPLTSSKQPNQASSDKLLAKNLEHDHAEIFQDKNCITSCVRGSMPVLNYRTQIPGGSFQKPNRRHDSDPLLYYKQNKEFNAPSKSRLSTANKPVKKNQTLSREELYYSCATVNLPRHQSQKSLQALNKSRASVSVTVHEVKKNKSERCCGCLPGSIRTALSSMMDMSLLRDPAFMLIGVSNFFGMAGVYIPFMYLTDAAAENGVDKDQAAFLIPVIGITNTISRVVFGYIADFPSIESLFLNNMCLGVVTLSVLLVPFCNAYGTYVAVAVVFGIALAGYVSLTSIILVDLLGLEKLTNSFGLLILFRGVATIIGSPIAGALKDATDSYDASFYTGAGFFLICTLTSFAAGCFRKKPKEVYEVSIPLTSIAEDMEDELRNEYKSQPLVVPHFDEGSSQRKKYRSETHLVLEKESVL